MANRLKMATVQAILQLKEHGWSNRRIERELGVRRETISRYVQGARAVSKAAKAPPGSEQAQPPPGSEGPLPPAPLFLSLEDSKPARAPTGSVSQCEPFRQVILEKLELGLSAQRIHQDLLIEHGFAGSYYSVRRFVRRLGQSQPLPFRRMETAPGQEAQVDFGTGAPIITDQGKRRKSYVFRIVLSHSRKAYSESVFHQTTESFIRCLENAFWHFGGVPQTLVIDNLRAAVSKADWYDPQLNPKIQSFGQHYGTVILPTKPYMPRHKGKVESGVGYVQDNGLKGRRFSSLNQQNRYLLEWERRIADTRIHGTTRRQVARVFAEVEKKTLRGLPTSHFPSFSEAQRSVHRDGHVEVDKSYYSVPPEYLGWQVWVRWDSRLVRIFNSRMEQIALHAKVEPGRFQTQDEHIHDRKRSGIERGAHWLLRKVSCLGDSAEQWARALLQERPIEGMRVLQGLLSLTKKYSHEQIDEACRIALSHGAFRLRTLREIIKRGGKQQSCFEFIEEHPIIRKLSDYQEIVQTCFR